MPLINAGVSDSVIVALLSRLLRLFRCFALKIRIKPVLSTYINFIQFESIAGFFRQTQGRS